MSEDHPEPTSKTDADLEREIRAERKFTLSEAIGRMAGPGAMKGVSPVTLREQAAAEIQEYLGAHLEDRGGVLCGVLLRDVAESDALLADLEHPLVVLAVHVQGVL